MIFALFYGFIGTIITVSFAIAGQFLIYTVSGNTLKLIGSRKNKVISLPTLIQKNDFLKKYRTIFKLVIKQKEKLIW